MGGGRLLHHHRLARLRQQTSHSWEHQPLRNVSFHHHHHGNHGTGLLSFSHDKVMGSVDHVRIITTTSSPLLRSPLYQRSLEAWPGPAAIPGAVRRCLPPPSPRTWSQLTTQTIPSYKQTQYQNYNYSLQTLP